MRTIINDRVTNGDRATLFKSRYIRTRLFLVMTGLKRILIGPHLRNVLVKNIKKTSLVSKSYKNIALLVSRRKFQSDLYQLFWVLERGRGKRRELCFPRRKIFHISPPSTDWQRQISNKINKVFLYLLIRCTQHWKLRFHKYFNFQKTLCKVIIWEISDSTRLLWRKFPQLPTLLSLSLSFLV